MTRMRLGLIARMDNRGLGIQTKALYDWLTPHATMVVDCPSAKPLRLRPNRFRAATHIKGIPSDNDIDMWIEENNLDLVLTCETPYNPYLFKQTKAKTALMVNYEFLDPRWGAEPDMYLCPSPWHWDQIPEPKIHLPMPVDYHAFDGYRSRVGKPTKFLHIVGRPAVHDRAGTLALLKSLRHVESPVSLEIRCQEPGYVRKMIRDNRVRIPEHVEVNTIDGDLEDYRDLYLNGEILVAPRKFGGLSLPTNEAMACGMPVIMTDVSPQNSWLPKEWLVDAINAGRFRAAREITLWEPRPSSIAAKINQFASDARFYRDAQTVALDIAEHRSWDLMLDKYIRTLEDVAAL